MSSKLHACQRVKEKTKKSHEEVTITANTIVRSSPDSSQTNSKQTACQEPLACYRLTFLQVLLFFCHLHKGPASASSTAASNLVGTSTSTTRGRRRTEEENEEKEESVLTHSLRSPSQTFLASLFLLPMRAKRRRDVSANLFRRAQRRKEGRQGRSRRTRKVFFLFRVNNRVLQLLCLERERIV